MFIQTPDLESFTGVSEGNTRWREGQCFNKYSLQVKGYPVAATSWVVVAEGGNDGENFDTIIMHSTGTGDGKIEFSGNQEFPCVFVRPRVVALELGSASRIDVTLLAKP